MPRPPPPYTLFPYTTLFRSDRAVYFQRERDRCEDVPERDEGTSKVPASFFDSHRGGGPLFQRPERWPSLLDVIDELDQDRKSTRLNSSHLGISYAVFCLKKN